MKLELSDVLTSCAGQVPGCQGATKMARAPRFPRMAPILGSLAPWYNFQVELALIWGQQSKLGCISTSHINSNRSTNYTTFKQRFLNIFVRPAYKNSRGRFQIREPAQSYLIINQHQSESIRVNQYQSTSISINQCQSIDISININMRKAERDRDKYNGINYQNLKNYIYWHKFSNQHIIMKRAPVGASNTKDCDMLKT